jgi:Zn-dependent protease
MTRIRWQLFRLFGIPVRVDVSWLLIVALLTWTLAQTFQLAQPNLPGYVVWLMGIGTALAFFLCLLLHEFGHALVARKLNIPVRGITLFLFGGVAEIEEPRSAGREFAMAIAGPIVSAVLAAGLGLLAAVGLYAGWQPPVVLVLTYLAYINTAVLVFNLIPAFPLDGGRILRSILWAVTGRLRRATYWASLTGQAFAWLLIGLGVVQLFAGNFLGGIWLGLIGLFLSNAAQGSYQALLVRQGLEGEPVRRFMNPDPMVVPPSLDLRSWVEDHVYRHHFKAYPVVTDGRLVGVIHTGMLAQYPRATWDSHTVGEVMRTDLQRVSIDPDADALQALERMQQTGASRLLVTEGGRLHGIVSLKDLLRFLELKLELEGESEETTETRPSWRGTQRRQTPAGHST